MARDVEVDVTANDKTGPGLTSAERNFKRTNDRIKKEQERSSREFAKSATSIAGAGSRVAVLFGENFAKTLARVAPAATPVLAGVAIAAAPVIGGTIAAAVIGSAAGLGIIGGVALAARNPAVQAASKTLGDTILRGLTVRSAAFVQPVLEATKVIEKRFLESGGAIERIFQDTSRYVLPLVDSVTRAVQRVIQGVSAAAGKAGPVIEELGYGIELVADEVARMFETLADDGVSAAVALRQTFQLVAGAIRAAATAINVLVEAYGFLAKAGAFGRDAQLEFIRLEANAKLAAEADAQLATSLVNLTPAGASAARALSALAEATRLSAAASQDLYSSTTNVATALANSTATIRENGKTLSLNTEKGRENRDALSSVAAAMTRQYEATVKANGVGKESARVAQTNRDAFIQLATKATGSAAAARKLADQLGLLPQKKEIKIKAETAAAVAALNAVRAGLASIRNKTVTVTTKYRGDGNNQNSPSIGGGGGRQFAAGDYFQQVGPNPSGRYRVGGPAQVAVDNTILVDLDGQPFRRMTAKAVTANSKAERVRAKVGKR